MTPPTRRALRVLHLEDSEADHELAMAWLRRSGLEVQTVRIETTRAFEDALAEPWDAILSDYNLPGFSGLDALAMLRASPHVLPFILVSGEIGEDTAVEAMRNGASDYLLKDNLARLAPALERAIEANESRRARVAADNELALSRERLSQLAQHLQTSVESERAAIAREIHDDVGGSLTALKFDLAWIERRAGEGELLGRVQSALETVTHAIEATQRVIHNLRPAILEQGLVAALQWMTGRFDKRTGIECVFRTSHETMQLPALLPLVVYRTVQEALTNISKHAGASRVTVDLSLARGFLSVEVSDNGRGFAADDLAKTQSFGIRGLHERAGTVGGWIDISSKGGSATLFDPHGGRPASTGLGAIDSSSATGTTLMLSVPLAEARASPAAESDDHRHDPSGWETP